MFLVKEKKTNPEVVPNTEAWYRRSFETLFSNSLAQPILRLTTRGHFDFKTHSTALYNEMELPFYVPMKKLNLDEQRRRN